MRPQQVGEAFGDRRCLCGQQRRTNASRWRRSYNLRSAPAALSQRECWLCRLRLQSILPHVLSGSSE